MTQTSYLYAVETIKKVVIRQSCFFHDWVAKIKEVDFETHMFVELEYDDFQCLKEMLDDFIINRDIRKRYDFDFFFEPYAKLDGFWHSVIDVHTCARSVVEEHEFSKDKDVKFLITCSW